MEIANASGLRIVLFGRKDESYMLGQACPWNFYYWLLQSIDKCRSSAMIRF